MQENLTPFFVNSKGAYQPMHLCSFSSTFVIVHVANNVSRQISIFQLVSVEEQTDLSLAWSENPKSFFWHQGPHIALYFNWMQILLYFVVSFDQSFVRDTFIFYFFVWSVLVGYFLFFFLLLFFSTTS